MARIWPYVEVGGFVMKLIWIRYRRFVLCEGNEMSHPAAVSVQYKVRGDLCLAV